MTRRRCAIYTRKSTEEGLDQDFNSLDAQRDACEAYIKSQAGEGWMPTTARYDDGGYSGATLERPGLKALLGEIEAGRIQIIVVYKVDRLTRSLTDFAKLVERFDAQGVSFVSVTQQFNTTTSMGRLTLNVLLSFAQFEREVTAERIRDKIAASKKKGLWMGGVVPLGYDVKERKLVVNVGEAKTVRTLFQLYLELGNATLVKQEADRLGLRTKARKPNNGKRPGGAPFTRGHLYKLFANPIYVGDIAHKGQRYPGAQEALISCDHWDAVQQQLKLNAVKRHLRSNSKSSSLLAGLLYDDKGRPMRPSHAVKAGRRYRYYISCRPEQDTGDPAPIWRLPAPTIEEAVLQTMSRFLKDRARLIDTLGLGECGPDEMSTILNKAAQVGAELLAAEQSQQRQMLVDLIGRIDMGSDQICITFQTKGLFSKLGADSLAGQTTEDLCVTAPLQFKRRGIETKLIIANERSRIHSPDPILIRLIAQAHCWFEELKSGRSRSNRDLAQRHRVDPGDVARVLPLAFLAPDIVEAIVDGSQPVEWTTTRLKRLHDLPHSWAEQRRLLEFG